MTTATAPAPEAPTAEAAAGGRSRKKLLLAVPVVLAVLAAAWFLLLRPGGAEEAPAKEPGEVMELEAITMNLSDGRLLKVGLALQWSKDAGGHGTPSGAAALDEAITFLGAHSMQQLLDPAAREEAKAQLSERVSERYHHEVLEVMFTEFVMQ